MNEILNTPGKSLPQSQILKITPFPSIFFYKITPPSPFPSTHTHTHTHTPVEKGDGTLNV